ncbi:MAG: hypothetical protein U0936_00430 [Planctomycetaceae bacterium]
MPDPFQYTLALLTAFAVSFLAVTGVQGVFRLRSQRIVNVIETIAVAAGLLAGYRVLQFEWVWPPTNAINRFLTIVLPVALIVELISGLAPDPTHSEAWRLKDAGLLSILVLMLRVGLFASIGRVLLHNSVYLEVFSGVNATWSGGQLFVLLAASVVLLTVMWLVLSSLAKRDVPGSVVASLSLSIMTAGISIMLAGYIKGGAAGFPMAASLMGLVIANAIFQPKVCVLNGRSFQSLIGLGVIALFSLLWIGSLFGQLPTADAFTIFLAPTLCWVSEFSVFRQMKSRRKVVLRLIAVAIPLAIQLLIAKRTFDQKLAPLVAGATEFSLAN